MEQLSIRMTELAIERKVPAEYEHSQTTCYGASMGGLFHA